VRGRGIADYFADCRKTQRQRVDARRAIPYIRLIMTTRDALPAQFLAIPGSPAVEWRIEPGLVEYPAALAFMEERAGAIRDGAAGELVWLVEHPPLYTAGTSSSRPSGFPSSPRGAVGSTPITAPVRGSPMSCST
jgi:hypothetical protein